MQCAASAAGGLCPAAAAEAESALEVLRHLSDLLYLQRDAPDLQVGHSALGQHILGTSLLRVLENSHSIRLTQQHLELTAQYHVMLPANCGAQLMSDVVLSTLLALLCHSCLHKTTLALNFIIHSSAASDRHATAGTISRMLDT